jgi:hypothetical protein
MCQSICNAFPLCCDQGAQEHLIQYHCPCHRERWVINCRKKCKIVGATSFSPRFTYWQLFVTVIRFSSFRLQIFNKGWSRLGYRTKETRSRDHSGMDWSVSSGHGRNIFLKGAIARTKNWRWAAYIAQCPESICTYATIHQILHAFDFNPNGQTQWLSFLVLHLHRKLLRTTSSIIYSYPDLLLHQERWDADQELC